MMVFNKKTQAGNIERSKTETFKDLPKNLFFSQSFPQEKYANGLLLEDLTKYIAGKHKVFGLREIPDSKYCDNLLANVSKGNSEVPSLNGFIASLSERNNQYSRKDVLQGIYDLVKQEKIVIYPILFSSLKNQKEELYGDLLLLAHIHNETKYIFEFIKPAIKRNLRTLIGWLKKGDTTKLLKGSDFGKDIFTGLNKELKKLMYATLIDPDNVASLHGIENEISDYGTIELISNYLTKNNILAKEQTIYLKEKPEIKKRYNWRSLSDQEKYEIITKNYAYFQSDTNPAKDLLQQYTKLFGLLQHEFLDRVINELTMNQKTIKLLKEFHDLRNDKKLKFPNLRYSELLITLTEKHIGKYRTSYTFGDDTRQIYLERGTKDDQLFCIYDVFLRLHKKALEMASFKFYDFNAEELLRQVKENIAEGLFDEIHEDVQVKGLIKDKEERLKTEFTEMYNQSISEIIPFDYNNYLKNPSAKINLINTAELKRIIKYQKYYEKNNYFLLPATILTADKETQNEDPWLIGNLIKVYNYTAKSDQPELKIKMLEDITLRVIYNIFNKINELDFNEDKILFETKVQAIRQELKVSMAIYNRSQEYKNSKLLKKIEEIIEKKLDSMLYHRRELAKNEELFNFDPSKGMIGVFSGLTTALGLYLFIGGTAGLLTGVGSSFILSYLLYRLFGRLLRKKIKPIEPVIIKEQRIGLERRNTTRQTGVINDRRRNITTNGQSKDKPKTMTKEEQDELWKNLGRSIKP